MNNVDEFDSLVYKESSSEEDILENCEVGD